MQALREAQRIEKQHKDRLNQLQSQLEAVAERENKIAAEKIALARYFLFAFKLIKYFYLNYYINSVSNTKN